MAYLQVRQIDSHLNVEVILHHSMISGGVFQVSASDFLAYLCDKKLQFEMMLANRKVEARIDGFGSGMVRISIAHLISDDHVEKTVQDFLLNLRNNATKIHFDEKEQLPPLRNDPGEPFYDKRRSKNLKSLWTYKK